MHRRRANRHARGWSPRFGAACMVPATASCHAETTRELATDRTRCRNSLGRCGRRHFCSQPPRFVILVTRHSSLVTTEVLLTFSLKLARFPTHSSLPRDFAFYVGNPFPVFLAS